VRLIQPPVSRLIHILRTHYGQYWIDELQEWDSRKQSLGSYLSAPIQSKWSLDSGMRWARLMPTQEEQHIEIRLAAKPGYGEFLTKDDWQEISRVVASDYEPSFASVILARTHRLLDQGEINQALIEGVTAVEVALSDFMRAKVAANKLLADKVQSFWNIPLPAQIISVVATLGVV